MAKYTYDDFVAYYGGTPSGLLRQYAAECLDDQERRQMFLQLAIQKENGVVFVPADGLKLSYKVQGQKE